MIQRIQTIYLFVIVVLMSVTLFAPLAYFMGDEQQVELFAFDMKAQTGDVFPIPIYMGILLTLTTVLPLVTIFLYKRRLTQIRLCVAEAVLLIGSQIVMCVYYFLGTRMFSESDYQAQGINLVIGIPIVCLLFCYLASRGIFRDEMKVRALDRIR